MMFIFTVAKSMDSSGEEFESAMNCTKDCVVSVLDDESLIVDVDENNIIINSSHLEQKNNVTLAECKEKIKGCFCDAAGTLYPEFTGVEPQESE
jgi:hypothetical protein